MMQEGLGCAEVTLLPGAGTVEMNQALREWQSGNPCSKVLNIQVIGWSLLIFAMTSKDIGISAVMDRWDY